MWFSTAGMERGSFWLAAGTPAPMYVEWSGPEPDSDRPPLVLIHGGGGQGTDWLITPDGRPGWAPLLADRGHRVYVIDRPGHGRGAAWGAALGELGPPPAIPWLATLFRPDPGVHPTAHLQTQWPAPGGPPEGDPALAQILCSSRAMPVDLAASHELERRAGAELLDRVGPAILCTHSAGGPAGWLSAAERPDLVRAIVALEPLGPPYRAPDQGLPLPHGLTAIPLPGLGEIPVLLVSAAASALGSFDEAVAGFLTGAGARVQLLRLAEHGVTGNGHGMIFERNHVEVLNVVMNALQPILSMRAGAGEEGVPPR